MTLVDRIAQRILTWSGLGSRMGCERLPLKVMHCSVIGRRSRGRQPKKWIEKEDMYTRNIQFEEAMAIVQDRVKWMWLVQLYHRFRDGRERTKKNHTRERGLTCTERRLQNVRNELN